MIPDAPEARGATPQPTAWTEFFKRRQCCFLRIHLKSRGLVGGYFGPNSYSTTYPDEPEVYLEQTWKIDAKGNLEKKTEGTVGLLIKQSECEMIEFLAVQPEPTTAESNPSNPNAAAEPQATGEKETADGRPQ